MGLHLGVGGQGVVDVDDLEDFLNLLGIVLVALVLGEGIAIEQFGYGQFADVAVAATYASNMVGHAELVLQHEDANVCVKKVFLTHLRRNRPVCVRNLRAVDRCGWLPAPCRQ